MKVLEPAQPDKQIKVRCTGNGNGGGGCQALLAVTAHDVFPTTSSAMGETDHHKTIQCILCEVWTDVKDINITAKGVNPKQSWRRNEKC